MKPCLKLWLSVSFLVFLFVSNLHAQASAISLREILGQNPQDVNEKRTRTPAQQKIDSQLLLAARLKRQGLVTTEADVVHDSTGRAAVDISGEVTDNLLATIRREGGEVVNSYPQFNSVRAYLTLESLETIARLSEVRVISRAAEAELSSTDSTIAVGQQQPKSPKLKQDSSVRKVSTTQSRRKKRRRHKS